jgi:hypothetical protein
MVFVNRSESLVQITRFFADSTVSVLCLLGLPGVGKSTLVRGVLELRRADTPAVWMTCEGLDAQQLLAEINAALHLDANALLRDSHARLAKKIAAVFASIKNPTILVLDGFEALLDTSDKFSSAEMTKVFEALVTLEHKAKVLVTTSRLPYGVGEGSAGVQIMRLGGLSQPMAETLFQARAHLTPEQNQALLSEEVLRRLHGHPKFIELLASAITEVPAQQVATALLQTSDIGSFVIGQVFSQMEPAELQLLRAALVFRDVFSFDALNAVHSAVSSEAHMITPLVRKLLRRAVLETVADPQNAYYLHPILREAVPREAEQEAAAHAAAGKWFLQQPFDAANVTTWDNTLCHLRRAAEIGRNNTYFQPYKHFLSEHNTQLSFAGWGRRLVSEYETLELLGDATDWGLGHELWILNENERALAIFCELARGVTDLIEHLPEGVQNLSRTLVSIKANIGDILVEQGDLTEARRLADEIEPIANASGSVKHKLRHRELRFAIARKSRVHVEMLQWATHTFQLAEQWVREEPSLGTQDSLAEAHFALATSYLQLSAKSQTGENTAEMLEHFVAHLRLKLEIGKVSGVAAGLSNLGALFIEHEPIEASALLVTSQQIFHEIETAEPTWLTERVVATLHFFREPKSIELGREAVGMISDKLLPFYQRALARRAEAAKSGGI